MKEMDYKQINNCIASYQEAFCSVEKEKEFIRYVDDKLPDMYDHNFIVINPKTAPIDCERIIREELARQKRKGADFCKVDVMRRGQLDEILKMSFEADPEADGLLYCTSTEPENLKLEKISGMDVKRVDSEQREEDLAMIESASNAPEIEEEFFQRKIAVQYEIYRNPNGVDAFICYQDGKPAGKAELFVDRDWAMIEDLIVLPEFRHQGIAKNLIYELIQEGLRRGTEGVFLMADADDSPKEMYRKFGFDERLGRTSLFFEIS